MNACDLDLRKQVSEYVQNGGTKTELENEPCPAHIKL